MFNCILETVEERINELEEENIQNKTQKQERMKKLGKSVRDKEFSEKYICNGSARRYNRDKETIEIFKQIMAENFLKL